MKINIFLHDYINKILEKRKSRLSPLRLETKDFFESNNYLETQMAERFSKESNVRFAKTLKLLSLFIFDKEQKNRLNNQLTFCKTLQNQVKTHNTEYINKSLAENKEFFDELKLDEDQRKAIVIDEKYNLLVAGAGSGKTRVLTSKIAYLIKKKGLKPERILALAFNNSAAGEMKKRLSNDFGINIEVRTFHSLGLNILSKAGAKKDLIKTDKENNFESIISNLFNLEMSSNSRFRKLCFNYISDFIYEPKKKNDFKNKEEYYYYLRGLRYRTLNELDVRSFAEREIANFFFEHNIQFEYERIVDWINKSRACSVYRPDFYLPEYDVYIEHWGLSVKGKKGKVPDWFTKSTKDYKKEMKWKLSQYNYYSKTLVQTWDFERKNKTLIRNLKVNLKAVRPEIKFEKIPETELIERVTKNKNEITRIQELIRAIIQHSKSNFLDSSDIEKKLKKHGFSAKTKIFGRIASIIFKRYEEYLSDADKIDFNDMINDAIDCINQNTDAFRNKYDYILIDEYQDISYQRNKLIECFVNKDSHTKLFCVGDDWQSIYHFSGSELNFFINFEKYYPHAQILYLKRNYRSPRKIVEISTQLIKNNKTQRSKEITFVQNIESSISLCLTDANLSYQNSLNYQSINIQKTILGLIKDGVKGDDILIIGRYRNTCKRLSDWKSDKIILNQYPEVENIKIDTIHSAKGTEANYVFICNIVSGIRGFPSEVTDDKVLEIVKSQSTYKDALEEERRLFYVALTRSKRNLYLYSQEGRESIFISEIKDFFTYVKKIGF